MPLITIGGVPANVRSVKERTTDTGLTAQVEYHVAWPQRHPFIRGLAGDVVSVTDPATQAVTITRTIPHIYPDSPTEVTLYCDPASIEIDPLPGSPIMQLASWITYGKIGPGNGLARIAVNYAALPWAEPDQETVYSEQLRGAGQFLTFPGTALRYKNNTARKANQDVGVFIPQIDISRSYSRMASIDERVFDFIGTVNNDIFRGRPIGTVLLAQVDTKEERTALGRSTLGMDVSLIYRRVPWNYLPDLTTGAWSEVETPNGESMYPFSDLSWLS